MIVSVNWLKKFADIELPIDELATLIGARLVEIEEVIDLGAKYKDVVVAKVVEAAPVPDSDHLNLCKIDDGGKVKNVERDENGLIQVVCGAPNVRVGLFIAWLLPKTVVPETYGDDEPFVLGARKLRGFMSNGMIASARELDLWDEHDGILEIDVDARPGDSFAKLYELDDYLLDIENKSLTHRPDCFGLIGLAREIAAIQGNEFKTPDWYAALEPVLGAATADLPISSIKINDPKICARYEAITLAGVNGEVESPVLIKSYLSRSGMRPISAAVDITNYLMLVTGQPLHAFDYDKLVKVSSTGAADIVVRSAKEGEKMTLLDGRQIEMSENDIVISAGDNPVALAGAMGGADTEIDSNTRNILLESATFDLYRLRNTQFRHGIFSEAITRFTKGQPAALTAPVLASAARMFVGQTGAKVASEIVDTFANRADNQPIKLTIAETNNLLGANYSQELQDETLKNIGYEIVGKNYTAPFWRTDIHIREDIVEDIGRINGFDNIEPTLPRRYFNAVTASKTARLSDKAREILSAAGANEVLTYSFINSELLKKVGQNPANSYRIINAISPELQYCRQSLLPSLLTKAYMNIKVPFDKFVLFEINKVHQKSFGLTEEKVPVEQRKLALVVADRKLQSAAYYQAKYYAEQLLDRLNLSVKFVPLTDNDASNRPFEPKRSAQIIDANDESVCYGVVGELRTNVRKELKLPKFVAGFELNLDLIAEYASDVASYSPIASGGDIERNVTLAVDNNLSFAEIAESFQQVLSQTGLRYKILPTGIYQGDDKSIKNISFGLKLNSLEKTLTGKEINEIIDRLTKSAADKFNAKVV